VIGRIDWGQIVATLAQKVIDGKTGNAVKLLAEARKIQKQIPRYLELDDNLSKKYGRDIKEPDPALQRTRPAAWAPGMIKADSRRAGPLSIC
jgi:hypothetical protein